MTNKFKIFKKILNLRVLLGFGLVGVMFSFSYSTLVQNLDGAIINRDPAAIRTSYDFSNLRGVELENAIKKRLFAGLLKKQTTEAVGISFGNFAMNSSTGEKIFACKEYEKIVLEFVSDDAAVNGEKPKLTLEGRCNIAQDLSQIDTLWIPYKKLLLEKPLDGDFNFKEASDVTITFESLTDSWPRRWALSNLKLLSQANFLMINEGEIKSLFNQPVILEWPED